MGSFTHEEASCQSRFSFVKQLENGFQTLSRKNRLFKRCKTQQHVFTFVKLKIDSKSCFRPKDCFYDAEDDKEHTLKIPFDKCGVKEDSEGFLTQTIVVQHDDWLIFPGDLAFTLQCKRVGHTSWARISLSDPDPSSAGKELPKHKKSTIESKSGQVVFTPEDVRPRKKSKKKSEKEEL